MPAIEDSCLRRNDGGLYDSTISIITHAFFVIHTFSVIPAQAGIRIQKNEWPTVSSFGKVCMFPLKQLFQSSFLSIHQMGTRSGSNLGAIRFN